MRVLGLQLASVVLLMATTAHAEVGRKQKAEAHAHFEQARRLYDVGRYAEAADEFKEAYALTGAPEILYNVAQAYRAGDQPAEAIRFFRRYLERSGHPANEAEVEQKIVDLQRTLDERAAAPPPAAAGEVKAAAVAAPPPPPIAPPPASPPPAPPAPRTGSRGARVAGLTAMAAGGAGLLCAGTFALLAWRKQSDVEAAAASGRFDASGDASGRRMNTVTWVSGIAGGVLAAAGFALWLGGRAPRDDGPRAALAPWLAPNVAGAAASVRF